MTEIKLRVSTPGGLSDFTHWVFDDKTVSRSTGIKDIDGFEIYEGDICCYRQDTSKFEVIFSDCAFRKKYLSNEWDKSIPYPALSERDVKLLGIKAIGNIYQGNK